MRRNMKAHPPMLQDEVKWVGHVETAMKIHATLPETDGMRARHESRRRMLLGLRAHTCLPLALHTRIHTRKCAPVRVCVASDNENAR